ncbi:MULTISPECIES: LacI family DNA-binding transcriptional regulator [Marinomonas]|uniref:LacI family DNA-binding transcriptional regulator n=1 Tax=Marinomonas arctica TaxID=383750 RepID=A0A7H1J701_9GAMM|nr:MULTISPECIES: LacI family DNA-binding transcriptional regulator [Marinomonas]MCS7485673.1 LacI family transcriptional regulator [Marinomonas sp. BSi20414]QNT06267.1 LacI family DNA-binding transcriptional regulator [Marinomonas arctica]GGN29010.1 LacI family transcriptional regulator [Marinomonas arctica]
MGSRSHRSVTAQDVAKLAGVSRASVSRVFGNQGNVARETHEKIVKAANELGYQVNFLAQGLNRKRSQLIGVVVARLSDPFRSSLLEGLLNEIQHKGYQALVTEVRGAEELETTMRRFTQFRVSGVIVTSGQPPAELVKECVQHGIPVVGINRHMDIPDVDFVCSDNKMAALLVAEQLMRCGCHSIGWLNYQQSTWSGINRGDMFRQAMTEKGLLGDCDFQHIIAEADGYEGGRQAAHRFCAEGKKLDGIFCANAQLACGFLDGMRENGLDAPTDFHIIGFDNTPQTAQYSYRLTTIHQDVTETAKRVLSCLEARSHDPRIVQRMEKIPVKLVLRNTSPGQNE